MLHIAKKKNNAAGFSFGRPFFIIGNNNITNEHDIQFAHVANDKMFG